MVNILKELFRGTDCKVEKNFDTDSFRVSADISCEGLTDNPELFTTALANQAAHSPHLAGVQQAMQDPMVTAMMQAQQTTLDSALAQTLLGVGLQGMGAGKGGGNPAPASQGLFAQQQMAGLSPLSGGTFASAGAPLTTPLPPSSEPPATKTSIIQAIKQDLDKQTQAHGHFGDKTEIDTTRLARVALRAVRSIDGAVFEAAGVNPKHRREDFLKVVDQIMRSL